MAKSLKSATTTVDVSAATAPSSGQVLTATGASAATWQTPASSVGTDGWTTVSDSWTYASASTINVPSGAASTYAVGDRIKFTQTTVKYGVIKTVADTLLTIIVNTDYALVNAAISSIYYSRLPAPVGYPTWFAYTPTYLGYSANPTGSAYFSVVGRTCFVDTGSLTAGTSNAATLAIGLPTATVSPYAGQWGAGIWYDNTAYGGAGTHTISVANVRIDCYKTTNQTSDWTSSGTKIYKTIATYGI